MVRHCLRHSSQISESLFSELAVLLVCDRVEQRAYSRLLIVESEIGCGQNWLGLASTLKQIGEDADQVTRFLGVSRDQDLIFQKLKELRTRRDDVQQMLLLERSRLDGASPVLRKDMQRHITFLEQSISALNQEFRREVRLSAVWR